MVQSCVWCNAIQRGSLVSTMQKRRSAV